MKESEKEPGTDRYLEETIQPFAMELVSDVLRAMPEAG